MTAREFALCSDGFYEHFSFCQEQEWKRTIAQINVHLPKNKKINMDKVGRKKRPVRIPTREETLALHKKWQ